MKRLDLEQEIMKAWHVVLAYYMPHEDYEEWMKMNPMVSIEKSK